MGLGHVYTREGWGSLSPRDWEGYVLFEDRATKIKDFYLTYLGPWTQAFNTLSFFVSSVGFNY